MTYNNKWTFKGLPFESDQIPDAISKDSCFVYLITNISTGKRYIGQKKFKSFKYIQKDLKKKKVPIESDWKNYYSSSEEIKQQVKENGIDNFKREIIYICFSKGQANYLESQVQMDLRVLEHPDMYYNGIVNMRVHWKHVKMDKLIDKDVDLLEKLKASI